MKFNFRNTLGFFFNYYFHYIHPNTINTFKMLRKTFGYLVPILPLHYTQITLLHFRHRQILEGATVKKTKTDLQNLCKNNSQFHTGSINICILN